MKKLKTLAAALGLSLAFVCSASAQTNDTSGDHSLTIKVEKRYINFPISHAVNRDTMSFETDGKTLTDFVIRLAPDKPDYWIFFDASPLMGKDLKISYEGNPEGLKKIYQDDEITGQDSLYKENNRPQVHFSTRRGWINDPNGMIYLDGEYHLYYQHNPFERESENKSWGHAISKDLIHWEELTDVMYPDKDGQIFSGTAVMDYQNTSGFGKDGKVPMVAIYTVAGSDNQRQCIAYSLDKGRTFTKYEGNPVIDSKAKWNTVDLRDPKVFWYQPTKNWVMVLYERDGNSIYTSKNLKEWNYESHVTGFFECPQFFELAVDGNKKNTKWVMYGASGTYMLGKFDGKQFTPESGKYYYGNGSIYAAQTFENIPDSDGRRIQIGWGRIEQPGMPFNCLMLLPTELTLRTTKEGIRMFNVLVKEADALQEKEYVWENLTGEKASEVLQQFNNAGSLRIKATIKLSHSTDAGLNLFGQTIFKYDLNFNQINGLFYTPEDRTSMEISIDLILDRTSVEAFIDGGAFSYSFDRHTDPGNTEGFRFFGNRIEVKSLKVYPLKSIWSKQ